MTYIPRRDHRFEYLTDAMAHVEQTQCRGCAFSKPVIDPDNEPHSSEYPMCFTVEALFFQEVPVTVIDDRGEQGLFCTMRQV